MLRRENALRLCAATQRAFAAVAEDGEGGVALVEELQRRVAREFGLPCACPSAHACSGYPLLRMRAFVHAACHK